MRCYRRCGIAGGERVPPLLLGWYLFTRSTYSKGNSIFTQSLFQNFNSDQYITPPPPLPPLPPPTPTHQCHHQHHHYHHHHHHNHHHNHHYHPLYFINFVSNCSYYKISFGNILFTFGHISIELSSNSTVMNNQDNGLLKMSIIFKIEKNWLSYAKKTLVVFFCSTFIERPSTSCLKVRI